MHGLRVANQCLVAGGVAAIGLAGCGEVTEAASDASGAGADAAVSPDDAGSDDDAADPDAAPASPNIAFVAAVEVDGTLDGDEGVAGGDAICQDAADRAGLEGTYVAWLSTSQTDASERLEGARGWVRPDGKPFVDSIQDLLAGRIFHPLRIAADGSDLAGETIATAWTGTQPDGSLASDTSCADWTAIGGEGTVGRITAGTSGWTDDGVVACESPRFAYCFGTDRAVEVQPAPPAEARIAFVTTGSYLPDQGTDGADELCQTEAQDAGLSGTFKAMLAAGDTSMADRFDLEGAPWVRPDGVALSEEADDLFLADHWDAALNVSADGSTYVAGAVWTGAASPSGGVTSNCQGWGNPLSSVSGQTGAIEATNVARAFDGDFAECTQSLQLRCLED